MFLINLFITYSDIQATGHGMPEFRAKRGGRGEALKEQGGWLLKKYLLNAMDGSLDHDNVHACTLCLQKPTALQRWRRG